jgi:hypothetical protein
VDRSTGIPPWNTTNIETLAFYGDDFSHTNPMTIVIPPQVGNTNELWQIHSSDAQTETKFYRRNSTGGVYRVLAPHSDKK